MASDLTDVLVAGYPDIDLATKDFETLVAQVKAKAVRIEGAILVTHDKDGEVTVQQTGDDLGRKGAGYGGAVGILVGLAAPPLLASAVIGAAAGHVLGRLASHKVEQGIHDKIGEALPPGTAGVIAMYDADQRLGVERALSGSPLKSVAQSSKSGTAALKDVLAEAMGKFKPDRSVLPIPDRSFGGVAGRTLHDSVPDWTIVAPVKAPDGAPNVLLVLIDDAGYGSIDTFGGPVRTPAFTRVQQMGVTYNRFHVTAVCSPTRAALLTGRNQHRVGFGSIAEYPGPFPGYSANLPRSCAPFPRVLKENGYVTGGFGKWHLTPDNVQGAAGPFARWPMAWGFDHWWGFLSGAAGQYDPIVTQDNSTVGIPEGKDGKSYYFPDDITDKSIEWLRAVRAQDATKPWMLFYSTGAAHAPHHVAKEWADQYKGTFDDGWDALRERTLARQKELGIVPPDTELTPRPGVFPAWDSLTDNQRRLYTRQAEVYAGFQANADWNVGRLLDEVEALGDLDNTLILYIWGDNGASMEGTITGSFNEMTFLNGIVLDADHQLALIEQYGGIEAIGGEHTAPHVAAAWAHAMNAPFKWGKQSASHLGGTRDPMVVAWPKKLAPDARMRTQFTHVIDVGPTILEAAGIPVPQSVDGIAQEPMDGTSFLYSLDAPEAPERHTQQYFEMFASRAMYKDGWWSASRPDRIPWDFSPATMKPFGPSADFDADRDAPWELYDLRTDFSQAHDVAAQHPEIVQELQALWWAEAERNRALPLMGGASLMYGLLPPLPAITRFSFKEGVQNIQRGMTPRILGRSYSIEADVVVPEGGAEGVLVANADFIGGYGLWVDGEGFLHHTYSWLGVETYRQVSDRPLPAGPVNVKMLFDADAPQPGTPGTVTLFINGEPAGAGRLDHTVPLAFTSYSGMDIGRDNGLVVDRAYEDKAPYPFTGELKEVVFDLKPLRAADELALHEAHHQAATAAGAAG